MPTISDILNMTSDQMWSRLEDINSTRQLLGPPNMKREWNLEQEVICHELAIRLVGRASLTEHALRHHDSTVAKLRHLLVNGTEAHANYRQRFADYRKYADEVIKVPKYALVEWDDMLIENQEAFARWCDAMEG